jgi:hypothetical protein
MSECLSAAEKPLIKHCNRCEAREGCYPERTVPDVELLMEWSEEGGCETPSGEWVEPDGRDEYGCPSWMLIAGLI